MLVDAVAMIVAGGSTTYVNVEVAVPPLVFTVRFTVPSFEGGVLTVIDEPLLAVTTAVTVPNLT
ncbi:MAG TPA: hypothetical protein VMS98_20480 [Thermoanaerobaculia bacterium]|nr:hypothetical protein [Thermoanaerobaculia bacterium]